MFLSSFSVGHHDTHSRNHFMCNKCFYVYMSRVHGVLGQCNLCKIKRMTSALFWFHAIFHCDRAKGVTESSLANLK